MGVHSHRSNTNWKQKNKTHKTGKHASKRSVNKKGQQSDTKASALSTVKKSFSKADRKNFAKQRRRKLNSQCSSIEMDSASIYSSLTDLSQIGTRQPLFKFMAVCPLHSQVKISEVMERINDVVTEGFKTEPLPQPFGNVTIYHTSRAKIQLVAIDHENMNFMDIMDILQQVDHIVFVGRVGENSISYVSNKGSGKKCSGDARDVDTIDEFGTNVLELLLAQKLPNYNLILHNNHQLTTAMENRIKELTTKSVEKWLTMDKKSSKKLAFTNNQSQLLNSLRGILQWKTETGAQKHHLKLSQNAVTTIKRASMYATKIDVQESSTNSDDLVDCKITGYIKNNDLDVNGLVHISRWGTFQIKEVLYATEPGKTSHSGIQEFTDGDFMLAPNPEEQQDLITEAEVDPMDAEQTWPTEEELMEAEQQQKSAEHPAEKSYRSAWLDEEEDYVKTVDQADDDNEIDFAKLDEELNKKKVVKFAEENDVCEMGDGDGNEKVDDGGDMTPEQMRGEIARFKEQRSHAMFPDEVDTPIDVYLKLMKNDIFRDEKVTRTYA